MSKTRSKQQSAPGNSQAGAGQPGGRTCSPPAGGEPAGIDQMHLERFVPYRLSVLSNVISMSIARAYESQFGLSIPEWRIMAVLARYPDLSAGEVAERTAMDKVAVSRAVQSLIADRRLKRSYDKHDRRRSVLRLSSSGQTVYTRVAPLTLQYEQELLDALDPAERRGLDLLLTKLLERAHQLA